VFSNAADGFAGEALAGLGVGVGDEESERLEEIRKGVEGGDLPEFFLES